VKISFTCIYDVKDYNEIQILNNRFDDYINEEIESKIRIINGKEKEKIVFKKNLMI